MVFVAIIKHKGVGGWAQSNQDGLKPPWLPPKINPAVYKHPPRQREPLVPAPPWPVPGMFAGRR